jgi:hypothetical protein
MMVKGPGSPARSASSNQTDSVLTESTDDESNFIALLQYKDAFHLLGLKEQSYPDPAEIRAAYNICKEQTLAALERCEANGKQQQEGRGSFLISQRNYLELKLNALDQAIGELLPGEGELDNAGDGTTKQSDQRWNNIIVEGKLVLLKLSHKKNMLYELRSQEVQRLDL